MTTASHDARTRSRRRDRMSWSIAGVALVLAALTLAVVLGTPHADAATGRHTDQLVRRPVTASGHVAHGYHVVTDHRPAIVCGERTHVAVNDGIAQCGSSADNTVACWKAATPHRVLCYTDPFSHTVRSIQLLGTFGHVTAYRHHSPQGLGLANGQKFVVRDGGAWSSVRQHPSWVGWYYQRHTFRDSVYGPRSGDGVNRTHAEWTVVAYHDVNHRGDVRKVERAYFVGTAR